MGGVPVAGAVGRENFDLNAQKFFSRFCGMRLINLYDTNSPAKIRGYWHYQISYLDFCIKIYQSEYERTPK
jgi:hypothetical protein